MRKNEYQDTSYPGIKQRIKDGKYIVSLDYGRELRMNKKKGVMEMMQIKTTKVVDTLKEAKALQGKNNAAKKQKRITAITRKVSFCNVLDEYTEYYKNSWSDSYKMQKQSQAKRMKAYFGERDVRRIDTLDIEKFFVWCQERQYGFQRPLGNNSIQKIKTHLYSLWKYMKKNQNKYGVIENVVADADIGERYKFEGNILNADQLTEMFHYAIENEKDYSVLAMIGLTALSGMRRGELCGLRWKNIDFDKGLIDVEYQRCQISTGSVIKVPKTGKDNGKTRNERKQRYAAMPAFLSDILKLIKLQQEEYLQRKVEPEDYLYMTRINLMKGYLPHPGKVSRRFSEFQKRMNKDRVKNNLDPLPYLRLHDLRHTFISLCLNGGVNQFQVAANCGHKYSAKGVTTTVSTYWHDDNNREEIIDFINRTITIQAA